MMFAVMSLSLLLSLSGGAVIAPERDWSPAMQARGDIDGDAREDEVALGVCTADVLVRVRLATGTEHHFQVPIDRNHQMAVCPGQLTLRLQSRDEQVAEITGSLPPGYEQCASCAEIVLSSGECDPLQIYWNPLQQQLAAWRA